ncbi:MAG: hypothetical protein Q8P28_00345 [Deltaproteobacteria bacterium]|nr:hypothetical protein [Deltaproteobacteria bacterium]
MGDKENINQKSPTEFTPKRWVGLKVFGIILILLGTINIIFYLKMGIEAQGFYILMVAAGVVLFIISLWRNYE